METKKMRFDGMDGLRAVGAVGILMMHVLANGSFGLEGYLPEIFIPKWGDLVFLFMVISGFSVCCGYYEGVVNHTISLEAFYKKRFIRVWPFFAVLCLLDFSMNPGVSMLYDLLMDLTLCFGLAPVKLEVIGVGWFLGVVFVFYFLFPFICYLLSDKRRAWLAMGVSMLLGCLAGTVYGTARYSFGVSGQFFMAGCMIYLYRDNLRRFVDLFWYLLIPAAVGCIALYYLVSDSLPVIMVCCVLVTLLGLRTPRHQVSLLVNPITKKISALSMEIYLSHMAVLTVLKKLHMTGLTPWGWVNFGLTAVMTLAGALVFSLILNKLLQFAGKLVCRRKSCA